MLVVEQDYYDLLGVQRGADEAAIKAAYRRLAKECHPDRHNGCRDQEARFKAISEAYDVLKDPQKRAAYDRFGKAAFQNGGGGDPFGRGRFQRLLGHFLDHFRRIHGSARRASECRARRRPPLRPRADASRKPSPGVEKSITVEALGACERVPRPRLRARPTNAPTPARPAAAWARSARSRAFSWSSAAARPAAAAGEVITDPCANCHGEGRALSQRKLSVKIPAGVDEGTRIRVAGEGEAGVRGAASGDLYLFVHMKRHPIYAREGTTLIADCPVTFTTAALGGSIEPAGARRQAGRDQDSRRGSIGRAAAPSRVGDERLERPRPRRSGRAHPGRNSDPDEQGAEEAARGIPRRPRPATNVPRPKASSAASAMSLGAG